METKNGKIQASSAEATKALSFKTSERTTIPIPVKQAPAYWTEDRRLVLKVENPS